MKIACVLITHLPVKAEQRRRAGLRERPVIIVESYESKQVVLDSSPKAVGITAGMPLQEALSRCKGAALLQADESYYRTVFDGIVRQLAQKSPVVERAELGCAYVGLDGLEAMYGGEARLIASLLRTTLDDLNPRLGLAGGRFAAYVAAVMSREGEATRVPDDVAGFLGKLPVDLLPVSWENRSRAHRFGLHTMGQLAALPVGSVQAQFGREGRTIWELANGIDRSPLISHGWEETVSEQLTFPSPATTSQAILTAVEALLDRAFASPIIRGKRVRQLSVEGKVLGKPPWRKGIAFRDAVNSRDRVLFAMKGALETTRLPGPLEDMKLTLSGIAGEAGIQAGLFPGSRKREQLRETMKQLEARLGARPPIYKVAEVEPWSRIPERRQALVQFEP